MLNLTKIIEFVKKNQQNILLFCIIALLIFLAFGAGILTQHYLSKPPLEIIEE